MVWTKQGQDYNLLIISNLFLMKLGFGIVKVFLSKKCPNLFDIEWFTVLKI